MPLAIDFTNNPRYPIDSDPQCGLNMQSMTADLSWFSVYGFSVKFGWPRQVVEKAHSKSGQLTLLEDKFTGRWYLHFYFFKNNFLNKNKTIGSLHTTQWVQWWHTQRLFKNIFNKTTIF